MRLAVCAMLLAACSSSTPGQFRPAKSAREYPAVKEAFRVHEPTAECEPIGVVHAKSIEDLASTAAAHGGTEYVVQSDQSAPVYITSGPLRERTTRVVQDRYLWANVYRCE